MMSAVCVIFGLVSILCYSALVFSPTPRLIESFAKKLSIIDCYIKTGT